MTAPRIGQTIAPQVPAQDAVEPVYIPELSVDKLSGGTITGAVIEVGDDGMISAGLGDTTVELIKEGLYGYQNGAQVFRLADGGLYVKGTIEADDGYFSGEVVGATITGSTLLGGTITIGSGSSIFRASELGIQLGSGNWLTAPFTVDLEGNLTATQATIAGTYQTAETGGRTVLTRGTQYGFQTGRLEFWAGVSGEEPAAITGRRLDGGNSIELVIEAGYDPVLLQKGPSMFMNVEGTVGNTKAVLSIFATETQIWGRTILHQQMFLLPFNTSVANHWAGTDVTSTAVQAGGVMYWADPAGGIAISGAIKAVAAWTNGSVLATLDNTNVDLPSYWTPRSFLGLVGGVDPVELELQQNGQLVSRGTVAINSRVIIMGVTPRIDPPVLV